MASNQTPTLPALDSMRAVAALAVLITHVSFWSGAYARSLTGPALARLDIGVAIFFVLSGFLLSRPWLSRWSRRQQAPTTGRYLWKRALRIFPVYVLAVVAALTLLPENDGASPATWVKTLLLGNIYLDNRLPAGLTQMWSLATEVAFYVVLPALMWLVLPRRPSSGSPRNRIAVTVAALVALNVAWVLVLAPALDTDHSNPALWLPSFLTWFAVGIVIAACSVDVHRGEQDHAVGIGRVTFAVRQLGLSPGICWTAALALFAISATPLAGPISLTSPTLGEALVKNLLYAGAAGLMILPGVFAPPTSAFVRAMSWPLLRHLGHVSYGVFCVHVIIIELVARWLDLPLFEGHWLELFALTLVLSLAVAEALYWLVERPMMRFKDLDIGPGSRSTASSTPKAAATRS
ncbi:acyltransferase family protein [Nocardioides sp. URHA0020]|uniref:acyltransferase family protein n=1 Tax=Nocardioides sp. URHA0020 TaxID=1380392 RepID=UPI00048CD51F|nr:acyltransferase [Nocardioides sp. URHA0020]